MLARVRPSEPASNTRPITLIKDVFYGTPIPLHNNQCATIIDPVSNFDTGLFFAFFSAVFNQVLLALADLLQFGVDLVQADNGAAPVETFLAFTQGGTNDDKN